MVKKKHTALVLASSSGLGLATAKALYQDGHNVIICSRSKKLEEAKEKIKSIPSEGEILAIPADISQIENLDNLIKRGRKEFGIIDILFTNGPGPKIGTLAELELNDFSKAHEALLLPIVYLTKCLIPGMLSQKWGRIIINTSITAKEPSATLMLSNVYRSGLAAFAKTLSTQLAADNITVNTVGPAAFKTERALQIINDMSNKQGRSVVEIERENVNGLPMKRYNDPKEFGDIVAFLASEASSALTGSYIAIDGGMSHGIF